MLYLIFQSLLIPKYSAQVPCIFNTLLFFDIFFLTPSLLVSDYNIVLGKKADSPVAEVVMNSGSTTGSLALKQ